MKNILSSMFEYRVKVHGYAFAVIFFVVDLLIRILGSKYLNGFQDHLYFHYLVIVCLMVIVSSKDKDDDERLVQIRYYFFKTTLSLIVLMFGILALLLTIWKIEQLSTLVIMYCLEGMMVLHLVLYQLAKKYNPKWLFREDTAPRDYNNIMIALLYWLLIIVIVRFVLQILMGKAF
jgi:hypothetical protein